MKSDLNAAAVEYALRSMLKYDLSGIAFLNFLYNFYPLTKYLKVFRKMRRSNAQMKTQGLSPSFVVASCGIAGRIVAYSDFSGRKQRETVVKDFPLRRNDFTTWYQGDSKPYQHKDLYDRINTRLGKIGKFRAGVNLPIGYCAEQNVANRLLLDGDATIDDIEFSVAIRPRTGDVIDYCGNCRALFGGL